MSPQELITQKRQSAAQFTKEQNELGAMLAELKKMQMAALMGSQGKSTVILTDQTDLGDKINDLTAKLTAAVQSTDTTVLNKEQVSELKTLCRGLESLTQAVRTAKTDNSDVIRAIKALKLDVAAPIVTVPQPKVTVVNDKIDFSPLQDTIREYMAPDTSYDRTDLSRYRAQDLTDGKDIQYVGFMNPEGHWYIIENTVSSNTMRYVFGTDDYAKHFKKAAQYKYQLLNEAIDATA